MDHGDIRGYLQIFPKADKHVLVGKIHHLILASCLYIMLNQAADTASGLQYLHNQSIVHGDLTPVSAIWMS